MVKNNNYSNYDEMISSKQENESSEKNLENGKIAENNKNKEEALLCFSAAALQFNDNEQYQYAVNTFDKAFELIDQLDNNTLKKNRQAIGFLHQERAIALAKVEENDKAWGEFLIGLNAQDNLPSKATYFIDFLLEFAEKASSPSCKKVTQAMLDLNFLSSDEDKLTFLKYALLACKNNQEIFSDYHVTIREQIEDKIKAMIEQLIDQLIKQCEKQTTSQEKENHFYNALTLVANCNIPQDLRNPLEEKAIEFYIETSEMKSSNADRVAYLKRHISLLSNNGVKILTEKMINKLINKCKSQKTDEAKQQCFIGALTLIKMYFNEIFFGAVNLNQQINQQHLRDPLEKAAVQTFAEINKKKSSPTDKIKYLRETIKAINELLFNNNAKVLQGELIAALIEECKLSGTDQEKEKRAKYAIALVKFYSISPDLYKPLIKVVIEIFTNIGKRNPPGRARANYYLNLIKDINLNILLNKVLLYYAALSLYQNNELQDYDRAMFLINALIIANRFGNTLARELLLKEAAKCLLANSSNINFLAQVNNYCGEKVLQDPEQRNNFCLKKLVKYLSLLFKNYKQPQQKVFCKHRAGNEFVTEKNLVYIIDTNQIDYNKDLKDLNEQLKNAYFWLKNQQFKGFSPRATENFKKAFKGKNIIICIKSSNDDSFEAVATILVDENLPTAKIVIEESGITKALGLENEKEEQVQNSCSPLVFYKPQHKLRLYQSNKIIGAMRFPCLQNNKKRARNGDQQGNINYNDSPQNKKPMLSNQDKNSNFATNIYNKHAPSQINLNLWQNNSSNQNNTPNNYFMVQHSQSNKNNINNFIPPTMPQNNINLWQKNNSINQNNTSNNYFMVQQSHKNNTNNLIPPTLPQNNINLWQKNNSISQNNTPNNFVIPQTPNKVFVPPYPTLFFSQQSQIPEEALNKKKLPEKSTKQGTLEDADNNVASRETKKFNK